MEEENLNQEKKTKERIEKRIPKLPIILLACVVVILMGIAIMRLCIEKTIYNDECTNANNQEFEPFEQPMVKKPIIYIYPTQTTEISVKLGKPENLTCTYPEYKNGWKVIAEPDGTLTDTNTGRRLYSLYWEGIQKEKTDFDEGFIVKGENTIEFLEEKLEILGLNEKEAEEFIVYWLPKLQNNKYNLIRFATTDEINENMPLELSEKPDTIIRILMQFKALDESTEVVEQELSPVQRNGFTVVEWGGTEVR